MALRTGFISIVGRPTLVPRERPLRDSLEGLTWISREEGSATRTASDQALARLPIIPASARVTSAQRRSRRRLARLRANGYVTLNARAIPNTKEVIDHLVVGPAGVFALDSERWDRRLPVRAIQGSQLYHGPFSQRDRLEHARWEAAQASRLLGNAVKRKIDVHPTMVIYGPKIPWNVVSLYGVDVFSGNRLRKYFRQQAKARRAVRLDAGQISLIQEAAERVLPPVAG